MVIAYGLVLRNFSDTKLLRSTVEVMRAPERF